MTESQKEAVSSCIKRAVERASVERRAIGVWLWEMEDMEIYYISDDSCPLRSARLIGVARAPAPVTIYGPATFLYA